MCIFVYDWRVQISKKVTTVCIIPMCVSQSSGLAGFDFHAAFRVLYVVVFSVIWPGGRAERCWDVQDDKAPPLENTEPLW